METLKIARELEAALQQQLDLFLGNSSAYLMPILRYLINLQTDIAENLLIAESVNVDCSEYPKFRNQPCNANSDWEKLMETELLSSPQIADIVVLWSIYTALDRMEQYYRQSALNSAHPVTRAYFNSLAEIKTLLRRRIDGLIRIHYNDIWGKVGFAPFVLRKD